MFHKKTFLTQNNIAFASRFVFFALYLVFDFTVINLANI